MVDDAFLFESNDRLLCDALVVFLAGFVGLAVDGFGIVGHRAGGEGLPLAAFLQPVGEVGLVGGWGGFTSRCLLGRYRMSGPAP